MPPRSRKITRKRLESLADIGLGERARWSSGTILLAADESAVTNNPEARPPVRWADWASWAVVYLQCREEYLAHFHVRFPDRTPGADRLFTAFMAGGDFEADAVAAIIAAEERAADPRRALLVENESTQRQDHEGVSA
jgi:hypothetical protein